MESCRVRVISDAEFDQQPDTAPSGSRNTPGWKQYSPYFTSLASLCGITSRLRVTGHLSMVGDVHENRERTLDRCIKLNKTLRAWYSGLPAEIDTSQRNSANRYFSCYIMSLYHQTVIWANWVSFVTHPEAYESEIARHYPSGSANYRRLLSGESQCLSSATEIVKVVTELAENEQPIGLLPVSRLSFAAVVLTVLLLKSPSTGLSSVYLMYLRLACNIAADLYDRIGQDETFAKSWRIWYLLIEKHIPARLSGLEDRFDWETFSAVQRRLIHEETQTAPTPPISATPTLSHNKLLGAGGLGLLEHIITFPEGSWNFGTEWDDAFWLNFAT
ncbi:hypothetical protein BJX63DRAFT_438622 [Aspergillus granulosus]|uniref:Uncharacterized protein n=1 Tax=Aspergillus granulosus TaxID=176169 RepID=A0ABR4GRE0_9EURO